MLSEGFWYGGFSVVVPEDFFRPGVFFFFSLVFLKISGFTVSFTR
jgi:hypothetical protein